MKKMLLSLLFIFSMMIFTTNVFADSFSATLVGNETFTDEITIKVRVNSYQDSGSSCGGICGFSADYSYDTSKIELVSVTSLNDFRLLQGNGNVVLSKATGVGSGSDLVSFKFKNKSLSDGEAVTFSMTNLNGTNGDDDITGNNVSKTFKYSAPAQNNNQSSSQNNNNNTNNNNNSNTQNNSSSNNSSTNTTNNNSTTKKTEEKKSSNADLKGITISSGELTFSKDILNYNVVVDNSVDSIVINVELDDSKAKVKGDGTHKLVVGDNKIEIEVIAEDGTKKTYIINVSKDDVFEPVVTHDSDTQTIGTTQNKSLINPYLIVVLILAIILIISIIYMVMKKKKNNQNNFNNQKDQYYN